MSSLAETGQQERFFVFLDRDGTLIVEKNYLSSLDQVEFIPGSEAAVGRLNDAGAIVVLISNQSGVGRGYFTADFVRLTHEFLQAHLQEDDGHIDAFYFCPHTPGDGCDCRKPCTGMLEKAARDFHLELRGYVIGDRESDLEAGQRAGLKSILVRTGYGEKIFQKGGFVADFVASDLREAVDWILRQKT
ncbi:MAG: D-glycero-alpha-D-manno-heptose-1,7-bisphosphate 7-phosphatase [bacterium]